MSSTVARYPVGPTVLAAAERLHAATRTGVPTSPVRDLIGSDDVAAAYTVQTLGVRRRRAAGARVVGRKIGLTSPAVQQQLGVDQPDFGVLFADMQVPQTPAALRPPLLQPKVEAELAFVLAADLDRDDLDAHSVREAIDHAVAALEIVDSRIAHWDISFGDTVADNASSGWFTLGQPALTLSEFEPREIAMRMSVDGTLVSEGSGADCLGDPLVALAWLARAAREFGDPLRAGDIVLSGALGPMAALCPGTLVRAEIGRGAEVVSSVEFTWENA
ncbi:2-keto-4-pentenoate hydratase [Nocardia cyriacigeorgica]|uniref:2-keto-4-pentenoate hydratase n=1 Tax=Nocardia cyriacigeorgica TaxID=135487 RepID=UPI0018948EF7|nr:fumarylacetoacetate hydrolase family protein [Nocardia cyriacigeorgica]MBF6435354.1 fumarylacetoacetate hydrolase family protein [Nocardia cyriacigeorgica]